MKHIFHIGILIIILGGGLRAEEWHVKKDAVNLVKFTSEVVVLSFNGITNDIDGFIYWEGDSAFADNNQMHFEVDLNTLDTGIGKRDRDMRDVLETDKWPLATFEGGVIRAEKIDTTVTAYRVVARGQMFIHGVAQELEVPGRVTLEPNGLMRIVSDFTLRLSDYRIKAPSLAAFVKVSNEIELHLDFFLERVNP